jgi:hypothetical protein
LAEGNRVISSPISARIVASLKGGNAGNTHEQGHDLLKRAEVLLDLLLQLLQGLFQKDDMSQNMLE